MNLKKVFKFCLSLLAVYMAAGFVEIVLTKHLHFGEDGLFCIVMMVAFYVLSKEKKEQET